jgi:hypothetical protein
LQHDHHILSCLQHLFYASSPFLLCFRSSSYIKNRMAADRTLLVLHGPLLSYQALQDLCSSHGVAPDSTDITTEPAALAAGGAAAAAKYSKAVVVCSQADVAALGAVAKLLAPGAAVTVALQSEQVGACSFRTPACPEATSSD